jgi:hypothetical protein
MKKPLGNQVAFLRSSELIQALCARQFANETPPKGNAADAQAKGRQRIVDRFRHSGDLDVVECNDTAYSILKVDGATTRTTEIHRIG